MKVFILGLLLAFGLTENDNKVEDYSWVLDEMESEIDFSDLVVTESQIKIYDIDQKELQAYSMEQFFKNELPLSTTQLVNESDFLFEYQGDSYYLK